MNLTSDHLQKLLGFPFRGRDWQTRLGIAALVALSGWVVPILPWLILTGYAIQIARQVAVEGRDPELPAWTDWTTYLVDGFKVSAARFVMALPVTLVFVLGYGVMFGGAVGGGVIGATGGRDTEDIGALIAVVSSMGGLTLILAAIPLMLALALILPVPSMHVALTGDFGAMFRFREWWALLRADLGAWAIGYLVLLGIGLIVNVAMSFAMATIVLCFVMPFIMIVYMVYSVLISEVVFAQAYRSASLKLGLAPGAGAVTALQP
ncbi:MAG: DUF4013 domain-containing protein [Anaerolineales bacterium]|nr:DUF4013 domain-containing protein [Anaerolineales bacterium]